MTKRLSTMEVEPTTGTITSPLIILAEDDEQQDEVQEEIIDPDKHPNFIEGSTAEISLEELSEKCIVPTFADGTLSISHQSFIESVVEAARTVFGELTPVEIRVSKQICGRTPSALHKKASELTDEERTVYYAHMAFVCHVAELSRTVNGQPVHLTIGGVRAYNQDRLYGKQTTMRFQVFCGYSVRVCSNLCLTTSGLAGKLECMTTSDIKEKALELFSGFDPEKEDNLRSLENLGNTSITEEQFCRIVGRLRLYQALPNNTKTELALPTVLLGDQAVNNIVRGYVDNPNFKKEEGCDSITLWQMLQLCNESVKQAPADKWLLRNQNVTDFCFGLQRSITGENQEYAWFLS